MVAGPRLFRSRTSVWRAFQSDGAAGRRPDGNNFISTAPTQDALGIWARLQQRRARSEASRSHKLFAGLHGNHGHGSRHHMPKPLHCIKDAEVQVFVQYRFQARRVAFTNEMIFFSFVESESVVDVIPLIDVTDISHANILDWTDWVPDDPEHRDDIRYFDPDDPDHHTLRKSSQLHVVEGDWKLEFKISTKAGESFVIRADTEDECEEWIAGLQEAVDIARTTWKKKHRFQRLRVFLRSGIESLPAQCLTLFAILANFIQEALRLQVRPDHHECEARWDMTPEQCARTSRVFAIVDGCFTAFFLGELLVNLAAHWFKAFFKHAWNVFDLVVVAGSLMSYGEASLSHLKTLRLLRVFRFIYLSHACIHTHIHTHMYTHVHTCIYHTYTHTYRFSASSTSPIASTTFAN